MTMRGLAGHATTAVLACAAGCWMNAPEPAAPSGWSDVEQRAGAAPAAAAPVVAAAEPAAACSEARTRERALLQAIERGDEAARHHGLLQARSNGIAVPDAMLKSLFETDASERVRLPAFEAYLEPGAGSAQALRSALEAALVVPNAAVQRVARQRLDELLESERIDADGVRADR